MLSLEGKQLGNYDVIKRIRVGGMGAVYEGRQRTAFDRRVAIKVILGDYANDRDMRRRFAREARTIAQLQHPHILPLIEFGDEQGILYLVMPFIEGGTLTNFLRRNLPDLGDVSHIYQQLLDAVEYAHDHGLIHRDIKSSNVLLEMRRKGPPHVYLADFGLVRTMRQNERSQAGKPIPLDQVPGTPHYMAPEQTLGIVTPLTDIYALGVILFQMLTGSLPYNDHDDVRVIEMHLYDPIPLPSNVDASIPRELDVVVRKAMAKRPEDRYQHISDLRNAFLAAIKGPSQPLVEDDAPVFELSPTLPPSVTPTPAPMPRRTVPIAPLQQPERPLPRAEQPPAVVPRRLQRSVEMNMPPAVSREEVDPRVVTPTARSVKTDSVRPSPARPRITEEPFPPQASPQRPKRQRKRFTAPLIISAAIIITLLGLLIIPRVLGFNNLPGIGNNTTRITITVDSKVAKDTFAITASSRYQEPDLEQRAIPLRTEELNLNESKTVNTSGLTKGDPTYARGIMEFANTTKRDIVIPTDQVLKGEDGIEFHLVESIVVKAGYEDENKKFQPGYVQAQVVAVQPGSNGNVKARTLKGTCCDGIVYDNEQAFTGGSDGETKKIVSQADVDGVKTELENRLKQRIEQELEKRLKENEVFAGNISYSVKKPTSDVPINGEAEKVTVKIEVSAKVNIYDQAQANKMARQILEEKTEKELEGYQLQGEISNPVPPEFVSSGKAGVSLNVTARGVWAYMHSQEEQEKWLESIKGSSEEAAQAFLATQEGVASVEIQLPFNTDRLPSDISDITISFRPLDE